MDLLGSELRRCHGDDHSVKPLELDAEEGDFADGVPLPVKDDGVPRLEWLLCEEEDRILKQLHAEAAWSRPRGYGTACCCLAELQASSVHCSSELAAHRLQSRIDAQLKLNFACECEGSPCMLSPDAAELTVGAAKDRLLAHSFL